MIRTTVKPVLSKGYTEMDGQLILDLPEEQVAVLYVDSLVKKFQVRLQKVRAAEEWTRQHFASASPDTCVKNRFGHEPIQNAISGSPNTYQELLTCPQSGWQCFAQ